MSAINVQSDQSGEGHPGNVIRLVMPKGVDITGEIAETHAARARSIANGSLRPVLLEISGVGSISRDARAVFTSSRTSSAIAVLGASPVDRVMANFLLGGDPPPCPTRFFTTESEAMAWLGSCPHA
ncbi:MULTISPECIES: STAS/SEC14 domain-containing protein [unclassified Arthrobacter]|uniref:STAS/SEC14 domain-containing protein n=1 Tax=unclassified Arthrobacter TaxID=235627 RepID=UPI0002F2DEC9|nr:MULTISPECIES: STAS/SEC14 domain-containing protein [unclassified Arthrobacter]PVE15649.1 STAS/SEC14 domain-containing protein [Arthrobacter sp. Bz4]